MSLIVKVRIRASFLSQYGKESDESYLLNTEGGGVMLTRTLLPLHVEAEGLDTRAFLPNGRFLAHSRLRRLCILAAIWAAPLSCHVSWDCRRSLAVLEAG